jgi:hypothetical protein
MTTAEIGVMEVKNEFNEFRGTDPRLTDEPFQVLKLVNFCTTI